MFDHNSPFNIYVNSCLMLAEIVHFWTVDLTAIDHIARDRTSFVEFYWILKGSKCIYMGNNVFVAVLGIDTYKLELHGGRILYLYNVLYASKVRRNLFYVFVLLELGFRIIFANGCVKVFLDNVYYGS